ncbi:putative metalloenzyme, LuxS/M16 peptidase, peptidase M16 [Dioscorea sansibarensis]
MDKDVAKVLEILADILRNPAFDEGRVNQERDVILREMEEVEGQTEEVIFYHLHATAFQYTPLGRTILGPATNFGTITKENLKHCISNPLHSSSDDMCQLGRSVSKEPAFLLVLMCVRIIDDNIPLAQLAVAFSGPSWTNQRVLLKESTWVLSLHRGVQLMK